MPPGSHQVAQNYARDALVSPGPGVTNHLGCGSRASRQPLPKDGILQRRPVSKGREGGTKTKSATFGSLSQNVADTSFNKMIHVHPSLPNSTHVYISQRFPLKTITQHVTLFLSTPLTRHWSCFKACISYRVSALDNSVSTEMLQPLCHLVHTRLHRTMPGTPWYLQAQCTSNIPKHLNIFKDQD